MTKTKSVVVSFLAISLIAIATNAFSQKPSSMHFPKVTFGEINGNATTKEKLLANPKLICREPNCEVTGFTFMVLRKDRDIIGPYYINGAQLTGKLITSLKDLPDLTTRIYIDSIQVNYANRKMQVTGISFQYDH